jgi:uncharacterized repeat protein (TIGR03806 family)
MVCLAFAPPLGAQPIPPYDVILGWDAASEKAVGESWKPHRNPLRADQVWTWGSTQRPHLNAVDDLDVLGLEAAFESTDAVGGVLMPGSPEAIPLDPTNGPAGIELWVRPASLAEGPQVLASFGNASIGASLTLNDDILRFQVRRSDARGRIGDDGLEDLVAVVMTRLKDAGRFTHVVATVETGGSSPRIALYVDGALATPLADASTGLFKDETLVAVGSRFVAVADTRGRNPLVTRTLTAGPNIAPIFINDWSNSNAGAVLRRSGVVGGHAGPSGGPLDLAGFRNRSFRGEIAIFNLYARALDQRQVAVLYRQVANGESPAPPLGERSGLLLNYDAAIGALSGGGDWENRHPVNLPVGLSSGALDWTFGRADGLNLVTENVSAYPGIRAAYVFTPGSANDDGVLSGLTAKGTVIRGLRTMLGPATQRNSATFELWFKPNDLSGKRVLFETGGTNTGVSLRLNGSNLEFAARDGSRPDPARRAGLVSTSLAGLGLDEFVQAVGVIDLAGDRLRLYVDGELATEGTFFGDNWDDGNATALGALRGSLGGAQGTGFGGFGGQIAIMRLYGRALSDQEVTENFAAVAGAPDSGLDARPDNATCIAGARPLPPGALATERVFPLLPAFTTPVMMLQAPGDASRWFVVEQGGTVRAFANQPDVESSELFIDISSRVRSGGELGLLGLAFHPNFPTDPRVYLSYTNETNGLVSRISEFRTSDGGATLDPASESILLTASQPRGNHNGGHILFGPGGLLYIGFGDGGSAGDPWGTIGNGQNLNTTLGKILRIDIDTSTGTIPYGIPSRNPYAGNDPCNSGVGAQPCPEIFAYGFRNPWRWSFDRGSGQLWVADVGQNALEEVNRVVRGGNYGWRCYEGTDVYNSACGPNAASSLPPVAQYGRDAGRSVTGGFVYRGSAIPALVGRYVFGDFVTGRIWDIARDTPPTLTVSAGFDSGLSVAAFGQDLDGELYLVHYGGTLHRVVAGTSGGGTIPTRLSDTGCVRADDAAEPAAGLIPYRPNAPFWSDGAAKERFLAIPNGTKMRADADGDIEFPNGSVLMKSFRIGTRLVETRLLMRHTDGEWAGYTYEWNAGGTDATRVIGGKTVTVDGRTWLFPSEAECLACHTEAAGRSLSIELAQLNGPLTYPQTGRTANQVVTLNAVGMFSPPVTNPPSELPWMPDPFGTDGSLADRARAYLHTNCSQCHRPNGGTPTDLDLRYTTALAGMNACDREPEAGNLGLSDARIIAPGAAKRSVLPARADRRDAHGMPPLGSVLVDTDGVALLQQWIDSLAGCD